LKNNILNAGGTMKRNIVKWVAIITLAAFMLTYIVTFGYTIFGE